MKNYYALVLDKESKELLHSTFWKYVSNSNDIRKWHGDHMTVCFNHNLDFPIFEELENNLGREYFVDVKKIAYSDKVISVSVSTSCLSLNAIKHITLVTKGNHSPSCSNDLDANDYIVLHESLRICLKGVLTRIR